MIDPVLDEDRDRRANPSPRLPLALCLDVSGSMRGEPIAALNRGLAELYAAIREDALAAACAQIGLTAFAGRAHSLGEFAELRPTGSVPELAALLGGVLPDGTDLAAGVTETFRRLSDRVERNKDIGPSYPPMLVLMTDGKPNRPGWEDVATKIRRLDALRRLVAIPLAVGDEADVKVLAAFAVRPPLRLAGCRFEAFFRFLYESIRERSRSQPGQKVRLDPDAIRRFAVTTAPSTPPWKATAAPGEDYGGWCELW